MKNIWIVNYYTCPPQYSGNPRHFEFAKNLQLAGYNVTTFSSGFLSDKKIDLVSHKVNYLAEQYDGHKYIHIKVRHFSGNGLNRMISIFQFALTIYINCRKFEKPDVILHNIHAPFDYPISWCAKKLEAKYIVEAWDLWPDSFVRFGLISKNNPLVKIAYFFERRLYEKADKIIFTLEGGVDYLEKKKWTKDLGGKIDLNKVHYINNGVNLDQFNSNIKTYQVNDNDLENINTFNIVYLGSIRLVNNMKQLIDAAKLLKFKTSFKFLIYGDGSDREYLKEYCIRNQIDNVIFKNKWIPLEFVPYILSHSSLNILNYQNGFGDYGISSGKLFQYLAAGKPICANIKMNYCLIEKNNLGIAENLDTPQKYAEAILKIATLDEISYKEICSRVIEVSKEYDLTKLSNKLIKILENMNINSNKEDC
jgi:glycosyltransferase involved in cell wall biosynthesis